MTDENYLKKLADMQTQIKELVPDSKEMTSWYRVTDEVTFKDGTTVKEYRTVFETTDYALSEESVAWCMAIMDRRQGKKNDIHKDRSDD